MSNNTGHTILIDKLKIFFKEKMEMQQINSGSPQNHERAIQVATCAILMEAAMADNELSREEMTSINRALMQIFKIEPDEVNELVKMSNNESKEAVDIWQFTNLINQHYNLDQKMLLMEHVWKVILCDGTLDKFEDYLAHKLKPLLRLEHKQWIEAKARALKSIKGDYKGDQ